MSCDKMSMTAIWDGCMYVRVAIAYAGVFSVVSSSTTTTTMMMKLPIFVCAKN